MTVVAVNDRCSHRPVFIRRFPWRGEPLPHPVTHGHVVLALYTDGRGEFEQRGRLTVTSGDAHLVPAGEPHRWLRGSGIDGWGLGFDAVGLLGAGLGELLEPFERVRAGATPVVQIPSGRQEHLRGLLEELQRESERPWGPLQSQVQRSLLTLALAEVTRAADWKGAADTSAAPPLVAGALRFIERNCLAPISLRDVAAALGRSPAHLTTAMRVATGRTAQQWISAGRLAEARRRLLVGDESVESIAAQLGYLEPSSFIRAFRREHGASPAAWRVAQRRGG